MRNLISQEEFTEIWLLVKYHLAAWVGVALITQVLNVLRSIQPLFTHYTIDHFLIPKTTDGVFLLASAYLGVRIVIFWLFYGQKVLISQLSQKVATNLRIRLNHKLYNIHYSYFDLTPKGEISTYFSADVEAVASMMTTLMTQMLGDSVIIIFTIATLMLIDRELALWLAVLILPAIIVFRYCQVNIHKAEDNLKNRFTLLNSYLHEYLAGAMTVQMFNAEKRVCQNFEDVNQGLRKAINSSKLRQVVVTTAIELIIALVVSTLFIYGGYHILNNRQSPNMMTIGKFAAFIQGVLQLIHPFRSISTNFSSIQSGLISLKRIRELLNKPDGYSSSVKYRKSIKAEGIIEFENVYFAYQDHNWILQDFSLKIKSGESVAIVGATGAGKTTITNLLLRFYDPQYGRILLDGVDIRTLDQVNLRRNYAVALQDPFIFDDTIKNNILLSSAGINDTRLESSLINKRASEFIGSFPQGNETRIGDKLSNLSYSQKQLISLYRVLCSKSPIFIFDEIYSSVDTELETQMSELIKRIINGRTSILISHQLSTVSYVDRIILLHKGQVFEEGTHEVLLQHHGLYWQLYHAWEH